MTSEERTGPQQTDQPVDGYEAGRRSITSRGPGRRDLIRQQTERRRRGRPYIIMGLILLFGLISVIIYAYVQEFVIPPRQLAVRVGDATYSRGDVVNFIRFNQRVAEDLGAEFQLGSSLFEALQTIQDNELAYQMAPRLGITVAPDEIDRQVEIILGMRPESDEERTTPAYLRDLAEAKRQFLNKVGLPEEIWRDFLRKTLFKEKVRQFAAQDVPRIQPQARLYQIVLTQDDSQVLQQIRRDLDGGRPVEDVVLQYSEDPNVRRMNGEVGWFPRGVRNDIDGLLFGTDENGARRLPIGDPSQPSYDAETRTYSVYIVSEFSEAREVGEENFSVLADNALRDTLNQERQRYVEGDDLWMEINDRIYSWVNNQVRIAALRPTPTPTPDPFQQLGLGG